MTRRLPTDRRGVSQVVDFVVAMGIFVLLIGLFFAFAPSTPQSGQGSSMRAVAQATVESLVGRPGLANGSGTEWQDDPEAIGALGLREAEGKSLAYGKIVALSHGKEDGDPDNGYVDYPSARWALDLSQLQVRHEFELEIRPEPVRNPSTHDTDLIDGVRVAYLGSESAEETMLDEMAVTFDASQDSYAPTQDGVDDLVGDLARYAVVVVGSNVDHDPLDRAQPRDRLDAWVRTGGGLVVLGSDNAKPAWLAPMIDDLDHAASGSGFEPVNETHPLRTTPHRLRVDDYPDPGRRWNTSATPMTITVAADDGDDATAAFALGRRLIDDGAVVLTAYKPVELATGSDDEGTRLLANAVHAAATGAANLDYGPPPIFDARSAQATRLAAVNHPRIGPIQASVTVTIWGGG